MKTASFYLILLIPTLCFGQVQNDIYVDSTILALKSYNINKTDKFLKKIRSENLKDILRFQLQFYSSGDLNSAFLNHNSKSLTDRENIILEYTYGDFYKNQWQLQDSLIYKHYTSAFIKAKQLNDTLLINETLNRLNKYLYAYHSSNIDAFRKYVNEYKRYVKDHIDYFWSEYYQIVLKLAEYEQHSETSTKSNLKLTDFKKLYYYAENNSYLLGEANQLEGIYNNYFMKNPKKGESNFYKAIENYESKNYDVYKKRVSGNRINIAVILFQQEKYDETISVLNTEIKRPFNHNNIVDLKEEFAINDWLSKSYEQTEKLSEALYYSKKADTSKLKMNNLKQQIIVSIEETKLNVEEKNSKIQLLSKENTTLETQLITVLPILGGTLLILVFIFYLYKRYKKKSTVLEEEQSETLQKLDELKSIVIKNHIILKDKTKVYISDLMYIKADDHYLEIITENQKKHTVRGKLNQIKQELPPNFIQCHRSYIVNSNFIKQVNSTTLTLINKEHIPLSRSYKNKF
ncbi:LytR/AlgR family response regulator transcription factor [Psychroserpens sp.]